MWTFCIFGQIKYQIAMKTNVFKYPTTIVEPKFPTNAAK